MRWLALAVTVSACYRVDAGSSACAIRCGVGGACPVELPACGRDGFCHGAADDLPCSPESIDARTGDARAVDAPFVDAGLSCGGASWVAEFDTDPTVDATWKQRSGTFNTAELVNGVWAPSSTVALDTQPGQAFATRTLVHVRMASTSNAGTTGARFAINLTTTTSVTPLVVELHLTASGTQTLAVYNEPSATTPFLDIPNQTAGLHDIAVDLDAVNARVRVYFDGFVEVDRALVSYALGSEPHVATLATDSPAEFDRVSVEVCP